MSSHSGSCSSPTIFSGDFADDVEWCEEHLPQLEFRSTEDEAWYDVEISEVCDALLISFKGFSSEYDEFFPSDSFKNSEEIQEFEERFRVSSPQMQDNDCPNVTEGAKVCAKSPSVTEEVKFYDAIVVGVERRKHGFNEEEKEVCECNFKVFWKQGPFVNQVTSAKVGDICLRAEDNRMNPDVVSFLKEARRRLLGGTCVQGEETDYQKILKRVKSAIRNNLNLSVD